MMLCGVGLWIILVVLRLAKFSPVMTSTWIAPAVCIASAALILISGIVCAMADGPFIGILVRLVVLLGLAAYAYWVVGRTAAIGPLIASAGMIVLGIVFLILRRVPEAGGAGPGL
jgi:hypothetical protein